MAGKKLYDRTNESINLLLDAVGAKEAAREGRSQGVGSFRDQAYSGSPLNLRRDAAPITTVPTADLAYRQDALQGNTSAYSGEAADDAQAITNELLRREKLGAANRTPQSETEKLPAPPRPKLPAEDFEELQTAWKDSEQLPEADRKEFRDFLRAKHEQYMQTMDPPASNETLLEAGGKHALGALDYGTGLAIRTPAMAAAALLSGKEDLIKHIPQDFKDAADPFDGRPAPSMKEYRTRAGIPDGPHFSELLPKINPLLGLAYSKTGEGWPLQKYGWADPTLGGTADLASDLILSPPGVKTAKELVNGVGDVSRARKMAQMATPEIEAVASKMSPNKIEGMVQAGKLTAPQINAVLKAAKLAQETAHPLVGVAKNTAQFVMDPLGYTLSQGGKKLYKSAFTEADDLARKANQPDVSEVMLRNNAVGTGKGLEQQAKTIQKKLGKEVSAMSNEVHEAAPETLVAQRYDVRAPVTEKMNDLSTKPGMKQAAEKANAKLSKEFNEAYGDKTEFSLPELEDIKRNYQEQARLHRAYAGQKVPAGGTSARSVQNTVEAKVMGDATAHTAQRARREMEDILDEYQPGMGGQMFMKNRDQASLMAGAPALAKQGSENLSTNILKNPAAALLGGAAAIPAWLMDKPKLAAVLMGAGLLGNTKLFRTGVGLAGAKGGRAAANIGRAKLMEDNAEDIRKPSPWSLLTDEMAKQK